MGVVELAVAPEPAQADVVRFIAVRCAGPVNLAFGGLEYLMSDIPHFTEAVEEFRRFVSREVQYEEVFWVFRDDVFKMSPTDLRVRYPTPSVNTSLARKVFSEGRERGLVEITAIATAARKVAATVWFPKYEAEEVQGWSRVMKLTICQPLPEARIVGVVRWQLLTFLPSFRRYQRMAFFIGTRKWAAA